MTNHTVIVGERRRQFVHDSRDVLEVIVRVDGEEWCVGFRQSNKYSIKYEYEGRPSSISEAAAVAVAADHVDLCPPFHSIMY